MEPRINLRADWAAAAANRASENFGQQFRMHRRLAAETARFCSLAASKLYTSLPESFYFKEMFMV
jgi:hypothetical protein